MKDFEWIRTMNDFNQSNLNESDIDLQISNIIIKGGDCYSIECSVLSMSSSFLLFQIPIWNE
jgi:hypothetical protein